MTRIPRWKEIRFKFWSVRIMLAAFFNGLAMGIFAFVDTIPPWYFLALSVSLPLAAIWARSIKQPKVTDGP